MTDEAQPLLKQAAYNTTGLRSTKDPKYLSTSSFQTLAEGIQAIRKDSNNRNNRTRSKSDVDIESEHVQSLITPIREAHRKSLYGRWDSICQFCFSNPLFSF